MMKRVGNIQCRNIQKRVKSNDENTSSVLEGKEEQDKENDSSEEELVVPIMITKQGNCKEPCLCKTWTTKSILRDTDGKGHG